MGAAAIIALASEVIPLMITAGMKIEPVIERLIHANADNLSQADWDFLHEQRAAALKIINDTSRDVPVS